MKETTIEQFEQDPRSAVEASQSRKFGEIRAAQMDQGQFTPEIDLLIASTALAMA